MIFIETILRTSPPARLLADFGMQGAYRRWFRAN
jgi:hypothetical protein